MSQHLCFLLVGLFVLLQEGKACCGGGPACEDDWPYWKRRIAAARKAKVSSSSEAEVKKDKPVWGPWGELICYNCQYWTPEQPGIPNGPQCKPPSVPMPLPKPPVEENTASAVQTSCSPVDKFVRCLCNTGTIGYACQYQDLMMQGCRTLTKLKPCVEKYANKEAIKKMWECDAASMVKKFAPVPKKAQAEIASVLSKGNCANFWTMMPASLEVKRKRPPYFMMLTQRLMMVMSGAEPALKWAWQRQGCDHVYHSETKPRELEGNGEKTPERMSFNITD